MTLRISLLLLIVSVVSFQNYAQQAITPHDTVKLKSGGVFVGEIIEQKRNLIQMGTQEYGVIEIEKDQILPADYVTILTSSGNKYTGQIISQNQNSVQMEALGIGSVTILRENIVTQHVSQVDTEELEETLKNNLKDSVQLRKNALSINALGSTPIAGITYERLLGQYLSFEVGLGFPSVSIGAKVYPFKAKTKKIVPHLGLTGLVGYVPMVGAVAALYTPIGISYFGTGKLNLGFDAGPAFLVDEETTAYFGVRIGYRY